MGYMIEYEPEKKQKYPVSSPKRRKFRYFAVLAISITILALALHYRAALLKWLLPGDADITAAAIEGLIQNITDGEPAGEAITTFCKEIITLGAS